MPAVPIFEGELYGVDVTKLLHKIYLYREDDEIEEGLCCRLFTVIETAVPQVFGVQGSGFGVQGSGFRDQSSGFGL